MGCFGIAKTSQNSQEGIKCTKVKVYFTVLIYVLWLKDKINHNVTLWTKWWNLVKNSRWNFWFLTASLGPRRPKNSPVHCKIFRDLQVFGHCLAVLYRKLFSLVFSILFYFCRFMTICILLPKSRKNHLKNDKEFAKL